MKKNSFSTLILLSGLIITPMTGCSKKNTPTIPYPSATASTANDNLQNFVPSQQGTSANPDYYGNGATVTDDNGEFNQTPQTQPTTDQASTTSTTPATTDPGVATGTGDGIDIPTNLPNLEPYSPPGGAAAAQGYSLSGTFPVDQDSYVPSSIPLIGNYLPSKNQWQVSGITVSGSSVVITAYDNSGFFKKGTLITMNTDTGLQWKNLGSAWLGLKYPMDATVKGVAVDGSGKLYANDTQNYIYVSNGTSSVSKISAGLSGATDIAYVNGSLIVSTSSGLKKFDPANPASGTDYATGVTATGGIGADASGNLFVVSGSTIKKVSSTGAVTDFTTGVDGAVDVAVTAKNEVCVLLKDQVKIFDSAAKATSTLGGDFADGVSIASSGKDIYVADRGTSYKDSLIAKYSILAL